MICYRYFKEQQLIFIAKNILEILGTFRLQPIALNTYMMFLLFN